jgi:hypothetical protein
MVLYAYMCYVCVFLLHRESSDMILVDKPFILEVVRSHPPPAALPPPRRCSKPISFAFVPAAVRCRHGWPPIALRPQVR